MHKTTILSILIISSFAACHGQNNSSTTTIPQVKNATETTLLPKDSTALYFPLNSLKDTSANLLFAAFFNNWYSAQLFALREPIIYSDKSQNEIYRFTWLRTFHNPITIRIVKRNNKYTLYWKVSDGAGGYTPGKLVISKQKDLDEKTWEEFIKKVNQIDFWNMVIKRDDSGRDGSEWILEGKSANQYHVVDRWTPNKKTKFYECCNFLLSLTDLHIKNREKY